MHVETFSELPPKSTRRNINDIHNKTRNKHHIKKNNFFFTSKLALSVLTRSQATSALFKVT